MEATGVSIGKSVLNGALGYATSTVANEVALQLGVQRDKAFVTDELEMMQSFLMVAHDERDDHSKVIKTWVKQVRDVAYEVEDGLQDFAVRLRKHKQSWWSIPRTILDRRHVANQMKELRTKVEDVSHRNLRYRLTKGSSSAEPASAACQSSTSPDAALFGVDEARHAAKQHQSRSDLAQLINKEGDDLGVIGVWGTSGHVGHISVILEAYENEIVKLNFPCRAWVRVARPFHPTEFVQSMVRQFHAAVGVGLLLEGERTGDELAQEFNGYVYEKRYLIVLTDLSTIEEWHLIKSCFPDNKLGSRVIVSAEQVEVASLCTGQASVVSELKQLSADQTIYAFYQQSSHDVTYSSKPMSSPKLPFTGQNEIEDDCSNTDADGKITVQERLTRTHTMTGILEQVQLIGRQKEKFDIIELIREQAASTQKFEVIALWGMGGLGKTTLIKDVYQRQEVIDMFGKHAFVTVLRPFKLEELLRSLALQLDARKGAMDFAGDTQKDIASMGVADLTEVLGRRSQRNSCLLVLDDLSATTEWDKICPSLLAMKNPSLVIVMTTRREDVAKYCCKKLKCVRLLNGLEEKDSCNLFTNKVFKNKTTDLAKHHPELVEPARLILKKCNGLPLAIVTIGGFLADQPTKTAAEWRKLNEHMSVELEMNPKFEAIKIVLMKSYDGLPYYLKSCFLYFSIFPEDHNVSRRRLVCRWTAEGYSQDISVAERYFMELVERSMIVPTQQSVVSRRVIDSCQLHDLIRDISISKSMEENLVFRLEEGRSTNIHGTVRHLSISSNWEGDEFEFHSTVDLSRIRSLTVFGKWRPFYISAKMRFLRVLDLEGTENLANHHLDHIGKLLHLIFLSLRECHGISYLPESVCNLRQLETLDIKWTRIAKLPRNIIKLSKLRYLHARASSISVVNLPRGTRRLKALRTLRYVHLARGNGVIKEIKCLTGLRKLGVDGINKKKGPAFCSAISSLSHLESLSVFSHDGLIDCLDGMPIAPENLQSLKLRGSLEKLPEWIKGLQNLVKLKLQYTSLLCNGAAMQALGNLPNLSILGLRKRRLKIDALQFQSGLFRRVTVLDLFYMHMEIKLVKFEEESMPNLEMLNLDLYESETAFSGLELLQSIKEVRLGVDIFRRSNVFPAGVTHKERGKDASKNAKPVKDKLKEDVRIQLDRNKNRPVLRVE